MTATDRRERSMLLTPGTPVDVQTRFCGDWASGFEIAAIDGPAFRVLRRSDRAVLPAPFAAWQLRRTSDPRRARCTPA
jgi:hypothetical protein